MNIKVAAFTVSEKSINISNLKRDDGTVAKSDTEKAKELIKLLFKMCLSKKMSVIFQNFKIEVEELVWTISLLMKRNS